MWGGGNMGLSGMGWGGAMWVGIIPEEVEELPRLGSSGLYVSDFESGGREGQDEKGEMTEGERGEEKRKIF